jgi:uncharacterized membrane protein YfcA
MRAQPRAGIMLHLIVLFLAGLAGGVLIAVAGGGTFITFPALLFVGVPPVSANASSAVALFPANFTSVWAYRRDILGITELKVKPFVVVSFAGALIGALTLLLTPSTIFAGLVPWLMLFATLAFAAGNFLPLRLLQRVRVGDRGALATMFVISIYGGYFGGGMGFLILATLTLLGLRDIHAMNGLKLLIAASTTVIAVITFISVGVVDWLETLPILAGSLAGGHFGAHGAKRIDQRVLKGAIVALGAGLTVYFFWHGA